MKKQLLALATFSGTIIGVGLFGLPYVTAQIGFGPIIFYFLGLGGLMIVIHLIYGEITARTIDNHRLPGYCKIYLGKGAARFNMVTSSLGFTGALLAYIIVGSEFLNSLLGPILGGNQLFYALIFFFFGALIIHFGSGPVSRTELVSLIIFFAILLILFLKALPSIELANFTTTNFRHLFLPYGVILFSIAGIAVIPEMKEVLGKEQENRFKKLIVLGSIIPIVAYLIFIVTVLGVTGAQTTPEALTGLNQSIGNGVVLLGFLFGIITTFTSFLTLGITLKKQLRFDLGMQPHLASVVAVTPAFVLFLLGLKDFINLIGFIGAGLLAIDIILIILIYLQVKTKGQRVPPYSLKINKNWLFAILILFLFGIVLEITKVIGLA